MDLQQNTYDQYADEYVALLQQWEQSGYSLYHNVVLPQILHFLGDVTGRSVLDAGCGEGYVARLLAAQGARVTAVDISARLIDMAQTHTSSGNVRYFVHDLSKGFPHLGKQFDLVVSNLVLNDVYDYVGYINTLGTVTKPGARVVLSFNNPYSAVFRAKAQSYYDSGTAVLYEGLRRVGVRVYHFHRTLEDYMTAFREAGFLLRSLSDLRATADLPPGTVVETRLPFIIVLELVKSTAQSLAVENSAWQ
jgi:2-polyprenyl-3-methyl-5-hydroxy-6-metoxy-1,4-benzoquinol methylase